LVYNIEELRIIAARGIAASMIGQILVEESVLGWQELELVRLFGPFTRYLVCNESPKKLS
jgi:carbamoylphosphate synthase large subunit